MHSSNYNRATPTPTLFFWDPPKLMTMERIHLMYLQWMGESASFGWSKYTVSDVGGGINAVGMYLSGEEGAVVNYVGVVSDHVGSDGGSVEVMLATAATT